MKVGLITDCLKLPLKEAIVTAGSLNVAGVQIYASTGEFSPEILSREDKIEIAKLLKQNNLSVSALCGDMGGFGFEIEKDNPERIEKTKRIIDLAVEFDTAVITTHIGVIPADKTQKKYEVMVRALAECGRYARQKGVTLAIETGPEKASVLKMFIEDTDGGVGVNYDPANFVMVTGQDIIEGVKLLAPYIVHTHAKDGIMLDPNQKPEDVYHAFAIGGVDALNACKGFKETEIGKGNVAWQPYLRELKAIGYNGYLTIEREAGDKPVDDITLAVSFLKEQIKLCAKNGK